MYEWSAEVVDGKVVSVTAISRSEEHTSELQSHHELVCRLLLEKKKRNVIPVQLMNETTMTRVIGAVSTVVTVTE